MTPPFRLQLLDRARHYAAANTREEGPNNRGPLVDHFQRALGLSVPADPYAKGYAWCACFVCCCGMEVHDPEMHDPVALRRWLTANYVLASAGVEAIMNDAKRRGTWVPTKGQTIQAKPGDLVIYQFPTGHHIGTVERDAGGMLQTVEGNTGMSDDRDGQGVARRTRAKTYVLGYVDLGNQ